MHPNAQYTWVHVPAPTRTEKKVWIETEILPATIVTNELCKKYYVTEGKCAVGVDNKGALVSAKSKMGKLRYGGDD